MAKIVLTVSTIELPLLQVQTNTLKGTESVGQGGKIGGSGAGEFCFASSSAIFPPAPGELTDKISNGLGVTITHLSFLPDGLQQLLLNPSLPIMGAAITQQSQPQGLVFSREQSD